MSFGFVPTDGYRNPVSFPTAPASEADFRASMQSLLDQIRDYMNSTSMFNADNSPGDKGFYQKLPSGLIMQWGSSQLNSGALVNFGVTFPTNCLAVLLSKETTSGGTYAAYSGVTNSSFIVNHNGANPSFFSWLALGY